MTIFDAHLIFRGTEPNGGKQKNVDTIIIHHSAGYGPAISIHNDHLAKGWWGIGYHYYIRVDGSIWRGRPEMFVGSHAGSKTDYNSHSIGICFEGNFETDKMADAQIIAGRELIADIKTRHTITKVLKHRDVAATACPGKNFRWEELIASMPEPATAVKVGSMAVDAKMIDGILYVPLRAIISALTTRLVVAESDGDLAAVKLV